MQLEEIMDSLSDCVPMASGRLAAVGGWPREDGRRAVFGDSPIEQKDPDFRGNVLFYEFFHGDTCRGLGASHPTGWTALIAFLLGSNTRAAPIQTTAAAPAAEPAFAYAPNG
jgi:hypothetical protein